MEAVKYYETIQELADGFGYEIGTMKTYMKMANVGQKKRYNKIEIIRFIKYIYKQLSNDKKQDIKERYNLWEELKHYCK